MCVCVILKMNIFFYLYVVFYIRLWQCWKQTSQKYSKFVNINLLQFYIKRDSTFSLISFAFHGNIGLSYKCGFPDS